jgi:hypothetical protein
MQWRLNLESFQSIGFLREVSRYQVVPARGGRSQPTSDSASHFNFDNLETSGDLKSARRKPSIVLLSRH